MTQGSRFRALLHRDGMVVAPGAYDCITAKLIEQAGVELPVIADADTGYGNELNAFRTVREFERSGVAGIHIEDQEFPKKCGHLEGKQIIPREDWLAKIRAA